MNFQNRAREQAAPAIFALVLLIRLGHSVRMNDRKPFQNRAREQAAPGIFALVLLIRLGHKVSG